MKDQPKYYRNYRLSKVTHYRSSNFKHQMKKTANPAKSCVQKILPTRNCRLKFIKNFLPEKRNENIKTKQPRFKSRLNK